MTFENSSTILMNLNNSDFYFGKYEFLTDSPGLAISCIILLATASLVGTCGNILIIYVIAKTKELRQTQSIFIVNLAMSDMYVTMIADPMSILGKFTVLFLQKRQYFTLIIISVSRYSRRLKYACI